MNGKSAKVDAISTDKGLLTVWLADGRVISAPLSWYPSLLEASRAERTIWQPSGAGYGIHWPALDYDLSVEGILAGRREHPNALRHTRETRARNRPSRTTAPHARRPHHGQQTQRATIDAVTRDRVKALVAAGKTGLEISRLTGVSLPTLRNLRKRLESHRRGKTQLARVM